MSQSTVTAGNRLRDRVGARNSALVFGALGVGLVGGGLVVPSLATLLFVWGGTALFVALVLGLVMSEPTVPAAVATDIYTAMAANARAQAPSGPVRYVPDTDGVTLRIVDREFDPVGERLLAAHTAIEGGDTTETLSMLADVVVNEAELATSLRATVDGTEATVTVTGNRVGTEELFDHPIASMVGVALATQLGRTVRVDTAAEDDELVVTCVWGR